MKEIETHRFNIGDIVLFRKNIQGDSCDEATDLYIPESFEKMVGHKYMVIGYASNSNRIYLEDCFRNHTADFMNHIYGCVFEDYWFDLVEDVQELNEDDIMSTEAFI